MAMSKTRVGAIFAAMVFLSIALVPAVMAQEVSKVSDKPSELEQALIDALNSNAKNSSTDDVIANYCKANKDKISISENATASGINSSRTYQLKDGSNITFTDRGYFSIDNLKVNNNNTQLNNNNLKVNNDTQLINTKSEMNPHSGTDSLYAPPLTSSVSEYNWLGWKLFTVCTQGYFEYNHKSVQPYFYDSWYVHNMPFNLWQISNWETGTHQISSSTAEIYAQGNFHYGFEYNGNSLTVQNYYVKVYLLCDQNGNYEAHHSITNLNPKLKIRSFNLEF